MSSKDGKFVWKVVFSISKFQRCSCALILKKEAEGAFFILPQTALVCFLSSPSFFFKFCEGDFSRALTLALFFLFPPSIYVFVFGLRSAILEVWVCFLHVDHNSLGKKMKNYCLNLTQETFCRRIYNAKVLNLRQSRTISLKDYYKDNGVSVG